MALAPIRGEGAGAIVYHGNIEPGDRVAVVLRGVRRGEGGSPIGAAARR